MDLQYLMIKYIDLHLKMRDGMKLRGYFANKYKDLEVFHNHDNTKEETKNKKFHFRYPTVQFKVIDSNPVIVAINEGANTLKDVVLYEDTIKIDDKEYSVQRAELSSKSVNFGLSNEIHTYEFKTPWMSLNQNNYPNYLALDDIDKEEKLKSVLIGNILSMSKNIGYKVDEKIKVSVDLKPIELNFKDIKMKGFKGTFKTNFDIPDYLGLGKSVSRGLGSIVKVK
ncbi:CRISPR-associated endonuclease Cas6 [Methanococcus voltae]|uniref:Putative DNA repair protein n=1 Tax=Methanococcus voltae (strain ATCC BAA-1334 / A3) TaxID=456320 RepID=D7DSS8_METV3|nr:CRISPR-associated endonuclease Cas6 [Methanococcus voltae]MCS3901789.1 hypothetical protein [Methanococcus voltae]